MLKFCSIKFIDFYSYFISPLTSPSCRFYPTCSSYARASIIKYGVIRGTLLSLKRLLRCHPLCTGGYDPVPELFAKENKNG